MALIRLLLCALFVFLVVTVAAFVYLEWWQAILVSFGTFVLLFYAGKLMVRSAFHRLKRFASEFFFVKSRVLQGATVDVHSVRAEKRPPEPSDFDPEEDVPLSDDRDWYEIEATIFPAPTVPGPMNHWDVSELCLVPFETPNREGLGDREDGAEEIGFDRMWFIRDGEAVEPEETKSQGPQRLRMLAGFPHGIAAWKFRYYFEQFGRVDLPGHNVLR